MVDMQNLYQAVMITTTQTQFETRAAVLHLRRALVMVEPPIKTEPDFPFSSSFIYLQTVVPRASVPNVSAYPWGLSCRGEFVPLGVYRSGGPQVVQAKVGASVLDLFLLQQSWPPRHHLQVSIKRHG